MDVNTMFEQLIGDALGAIDGEVVDRTRAVDRLLDLRNAAGSPALEAAVDDALRGLPGRTMVASADWRALLEGLGALASLAADTVG